MKINKFMQTTLIILIIGLITAFILIRIPLNKMATGIPNSSKNLVTEDMAKISNTNYDKLKQKLNEYIVKNNLAVGLFFKDISTNTTFGINEDKVFTAASTIKVPIILYLYQQASEGKVNLATKVSYNKATDFESGAGVLEHIARQGDKYTLKTLAHLTITTSDNITNRMIMRYLGKDNIINFMKDIGGKTVYPNGKNITTARDMVTYLEAVIAFAKANPDLGKTLLDDMANSVYNSGIPAKLPEELYIPHKEGDLDDVANDVGIVYGQRPYILAILTSGNKDLDKGFAHIAELSKIIYDYQKSFNITYENTNNNSVKEVSNIDSTDNITSELKSFFLYKGKSLLNGKYDDLKYFFDLDSTYGKWSYEHEQRRVRYIISWIKNRGLKFTDINSEFRVINTERKGNSTWIYLVETMNAKYKYNDVNKENYFGIGIRHAIELVNKNGKFLVKTDWYTDPLDEDTIVQDVTPATGSFSFPSRPLIQPVQVKNGSWRYDREQAVRYADLYNGGAYKTEKNYRYNQKYKDYTGVGGDCTNFVSQCLADEEGGRLPTDYTWFYGKDGSRAWLQADMLASYLLYTGKGSLVAKGKYNDVLKYLPYMQKGDLIAYEEKNDIVHFAIITGFDSKSNPVVNSHTSDRFHVPWDLGWDRKTVFRLIHING